MDSGASSQDHLSAAISPSRMSRPDLVLARLSYWKTALFCAVTISFGGLPWIFILKGAPADIHNPARWVAAAIIGGLAGLFFLFAGLRMMATALTGRSVLQLKRGRLEYLVFVPGVEPDQVRNVKLLYSRSTDTPYLAADLRDGSRRNWSLATAADRPEDVLAAVVRVTGASADRW